MNTEKPKTIKLKKFKSGDFFATFLVLTFELYESITKQIKTCPGGQVFKFWLRGLDLNQRPSGYEPDELPGCSTPRH